MLAVLFRGKRPRYRPHSGTALRQILPAKMPHLQRCCRSVAKNRLLSRRRSTIEIDLEGDPFAQVSSIERAPRRVTELCWSGERSAILGCQPPVMGVLDRVLRYKHCDLFFLHKLGEMLLPVGINALN